MTTFDQRIVIAAQELVNDAMLSLLGGMRNQTVRTHRRNGHAQRHQVR